MIDITECLADEAEAVISPVYTGWPEKPGREVRRYMVIDEGARNPVRLDSDGGELITEITVRVAIYDRSPAAVAEDAERLMALFKKHLGRLIDYRRAWSTGNSLYTAQMSVAFVVDKRGQCYRSV